MPQLVGRPVHNSLVDALRSMSEGVGASASAYVAASPDREKNLAVQTANQRRADAIAKGNDALRRGDMREFLAQSMLADRSGADALAYSQASGGLPLSLTQEGRKYLAPPGPITTAAPGQNAAPSNAVTRQSIASNPTTQQASYRAAPLDQVNAGMSQPAVQPAAPSVSAPPQATPAAPMTDTAMPAPQATSPLAAMIANAGANMLPATARRRPATNPFDSGSGSGLFN